MKVIRLAVFSLLLMSFWLVGVAQSAPNDELQLPGDHYRWLLDSPMRPYLSNDAENYLWLKYGGTSSPLSNEERDGLDAIGGLDQRVNDPGEDKNPAHTTQSETTIAVFGQNVALGWNDIGQVATTNSSSGYGYSSDGGRTFTDGGDIPPVKGGANLGDPDLAVDRKGNFYFSQIALDDKGIAFIGVSKSTDGGRTFSPPVNASRSVSGPDSFTDKEFITADATGRRYDGNIYVSWTHFTANSATIMLARSTDGGRTFEKPIALSQPDHDVQGSIPRIGPKGEVYVAWEDFSAPGIHISKSTDGGRTFGADGVDNVLVTPIEFIGKQAPPATCQGRRILNGFIDAGFEFPSLAISPVNGEIYIVFDSNPPGPDQSDVYFTRSSDGGQSWSKPVRLNDDHTTTDQFMPAVTVAPNGTVAAIWYDRRNDPANLKLDIYMAVSPDGGRTWQPNQRITTASSDVPPLSPNFDSVRPCYMGDYIHLAADMQNIYSVWGDNRDRGLTWKTLPDMPTPRELTANAAIGNTVFAIGGTKLGFRQAGDSTANEAYDTQSARWSQLTPMPLARSGAAAVSKDLSIYVLGGMTSDLGGVTGALERYDVLTDRWVELTPMPTPRWGLGAAIVGGKIYAIGGQNCISELCGQTLDSVEVYDIQTDRWSTAAPLPAPRTDLTATVLLNGKIYTFGGFDPKKQQPSTDVNIYDPVANHWSQAKPMSRKRAGAAAGVCGQKIVLSDGYTTNFTQIRRYTQLYDPATDSWTFVAAPKFERQGIQAAYANGVLYAIGGSMASRVRHNGANEAFDCQHLGFDRPDPNIYFDRRPIPGEGGTAVSPLVSVASAADLANRVQGLQLKTTEAINQPAGLIFRVEGQQIAAVQVDVYNLKGEKLFDSGAVAGQTLRWDLQAGSSNRLANGVYLYVVTVRGTDGRVIRDQVRKLVLLR